LPAELELAGKARDLLALYRKHEDLIAIGAYAKGSNPRIDLAIEKHEPLLQFLRQKIEEKFSRTESFQQIGALVQ
jgi:flagellum-specific ATP synthase